MREGFLFYGKNKRTPHFPRFEHSPHRTLYLGQEQQRTPLSVRHWMESSQGPCQEHSQRVRKVSVVFFFSFKPEHAHVRMFSKQGSKVANGMWNKKENTLFVQTLIKKSLSRD